MAFSRVLDDTELVVAGNTSITSEWVGDVLVDVGLNPVGTSCAVLFSSRAAEWAGAAPSRRRWSSVRPAT